jgi:lysophospholipase L1-like esterase
MRNRIRLILAPAVALLALTAASAAPHPVSAAAKSVSPYAGSDGVLQIMPLGDSIARGHPGTGSPAWAGFRLDLRARFDSVGAVPNMVGPWLDGSGDNNHAGTSGARIDQINAQVPQAMVNYRPDVVLVMAGTNDVGQNYELATATDRMVALIQRVRQFRPTARVFVATIPAWGDPLRMPAVNAMNDSIRAAIAAAADPKVSMVPNHIVGQDPAKDLHPDGVHPTPCGYAKLAYVWWMYVNNSDVNPTPNSWPNANYPWTAPAPHPCA